MEEQKRERKVGDAVIYVDPVGGQHNALVTAWWSDTCCNLVLTSGDEAKRDDYGRQIERQTSMNHKDVGGLAHGFYWMWPGEEPNPYKPPLAV